MNSVVFVHGLGSNPDTTWRAEKIQEQSHCGSSKEYVCWITDFLPNDISSPMCEEVRLFLYNYDSFWQRDAVKTRLFELGEGMLQKLREIQKTEDISESVVFLALQTNILFD